MLIRGKFFAEKKPGKEETESSSGAPLTKQQINTSIKNIYTTLGFKDEVQGVEYLSFPLKFKSYREYEIYVSFREKQAQRDAAWNDYYKLIELLTEEELNTEKWRTYVYLRKCVLDYKRNNPNEELTPLLKFLETSNANKSWLAKKLLDKSTQKDDEYWSSGQHEWLERSLIIDVLKRSAGMVKGVEAEIEDYCIAGTFDWLFVQADLRSPTKYIFFKNDDNAIKSGHDGAVKAEAKRGKKGTQTKGSYEFHKKLAEAFYNSTKIASFIKRVEKIFKEDTISGKKSLSPDVNRNYVITGEPTDNVLDINEFRKNKLLPEGYKHTKETISDLFIWANRFNSDTAELSASSAESDSSEEESLAVKEDITDEIFITNLRMS